jgi:HK97 gp10 family phage protein
MSGQVRLRIINIDQFNAQLSLLSDALREAVLQAALMTGADPIVNRWKQTAPFRTGTYRRSIQAQPLPSAGTHKSAVQIGTDITDPPYPVYLEFGTSRMAARPSARQAWDAEIDKAVDEVVAALEQALKAAAE